MPLRRSTSELLNPMTNPSFPFVTFTSGFVVLMLWELWLLSNEDIPYVLGVPISILCFGGWDKVICCRSCSEEIHPKNFGKI